MKNHSSMLLTTADRQIEKFTATSNPTESLEDALYEAILFHEKAVLPDIFAFISSPISESQKNPGRTHLESALEAGLVVPAFRSGCTSFTQSLETITRQGIQGTQRAPRLTANRFDDALSKAKTPSIKNWPEDLSRDYGRKFIDGLKLINGDGEKFLPSNLSSNLGITGQFIRERRIIEQTEAVLVGGELRRGEVYNLLLRELEKEIITGKDVVHDSYADLILHEACEKNTRIAVAIRNLVVLANTVYQLNLADAFEARNYAPGRLFSKESLPALCVALNCSRGVKANSEISKEVDSEVFTVEVPLPNIKQLRTVDWKDLLAIRDDVGAGYFAALKNWKEYPDTFEKTLRAYAAALTSRVKVKAPPLTIFLKALAESEREGVASVARQAIAMASDGVVGDKILALAGIGSSIVLSWRYEQMKTIAFAHSPTASIVL